MFIKACLSKIFMLINDRVYGEIEITEPVLLELINSKPVQRLKDINQAGSSMYVMNKPITRFEHSIGVMFLLKMLGASIEEQIAGLIHDVPHTAFSHVIDYVFKNEEQDFHEKFHEKIIMDSEIPEILKKYDFDVKRLLDEHNFPLLERKLPDLCADRIDYTLRDYVTYFCLDDKIKDILSHLIIHNDEIIFNNKNIAKTFAEIFLLCDNSYWTDIREVGCFNIMADALRIALDNNILSESDLFENGAFVYDKLKNSDNKEILKKLEFLNPNLKIINDESNPDYITKSKLRYVDPKFLENNNICKVSEHFPDFKKTLDEHNARIKKGFFVKIVSY